MLGRNSQHWGEKNPGKSSPAFGKDDGASYAQIWAENWKNCLQPFHMILVGEG
jgi:hypothetical protein